MTESFEKLLSSDLEEISGGSADQGVCNCTSGALQALSNEKPSKETDGGSLN